MFSEFKSVARSLARSPGYTSTVVLTLALGIGAAAAAYSAVAGSLFPTLPYDKPEELVRIELVNREQPQPTSPFLLRFLAYRDATSFSGLASTSYDSMNLLLNQEPEGINVGRVTDNFFSVLGVVPALGRVFGPADGRAGTENVVILSDWFWKNRLASDPNVLGRELLLNGRPYRVVGVLAEDFRMPVAIPNGRLYIPYVVPVATTNQNQWNPMATVGRLKPGIPRAQAQAELQTMRPERGRPIETFMGKYDVRVSRIDLPPESPGYRRYLLMQWTGVGAVAFLYAIACVNAGNLMLVRTIGRRRETGIRLALGGGRWDIARPLLVEGMVVALVSIVLGWMVAKWLMPALLAMAPGGDDSFTRNLKLSWEAVGFLAGLGLVTGMAVAAGPAWRAARLNVNDAVKEGGAAMGESRRLRAVRGTLVVLEAALAVALLTGAGLMVRTFVQLQDVKPGFDPVHRYNVNLQISREENLNAGARRERYKQIAERLARVPGVSGASLTAMMLPSFYSPQKFKIAGRSDNVEVEAQGTPCSPDYLEVLGVPLKAGASLTTLHEGGAPGIVINETMARTYFADRNPVGEQLQINDKTLWEIIGVVGDVRSMRLEAKPRFYLPYWQPWGGVSGILLRTSGAPGPEFINEIRRAAYEVDPKFAVMSVTELDRQLKQEVTTERFMLAVLEVMSVLALLLAIMGMFTMMAYTVEQRRSEFGIRFALGATPNGIHRLVLGRGMALAATGVALGLGLAWALSRFMESLLYQTKTGDPVTYAMVGGLMLIVAIPACWVPAHRATKVDLTVLLRPQ